MDTKPFVSLAVFLKTSFFQSMSGYTNGSLPSLNFCSSESV